MRGVARSRNTGGGLLLQLTGSDDPEGGGVALLGDDLARSEGPFESQVETVVGEFVVIHRKVGEDVLLDVDGGRTASFRQRRDGLLDHIDKRRVSRRTGFRLL